MSQDIPINLAEDTISLEELKSVADWMLSNPRLTKGAVTEQFESDFAATVGAKYAVFVNSGSSANLLAASVAMQSGRLKSRRAMCPAVSWVTTVTPFQQLGYQVELTGTDEKSLGTSVEELERRFQKDSPAVLVLVHVLGHSNDMDKIVDLCQAHDVFLIEDACEALGSTTSNGKWLGTIGEIGTYSFYYGHHISTIEGGMAVTDDQELYELMLSVRSHGWSRDLSPSRRFELQSEWEIDDFSNFYSFYYSGFNLRPTDLQAKFGTTQLGLIENIADVREKNFETYKSLLPNFWSQASPTERLSSFAYGTLVSNREELAAALRRHQIESRPLVCGNIGRHPFWLKENQPFQDAVADNVHRYGIYLPNHFRLTHDQIDKICSIVREYGQPLENGSERSV